MRVLRQVLENVLTFLDVPGKRLCHYVCSSWRAMSKSVTFLEKAQITRAVESSLPTNAAGELHCE